jgi:hypothetical protein
VCFRKDVISMYGSINPLGNEKMEGGVEEGLGMELELFLRPTVSRPVRLGIGPPFGILDQILSCSSFV